MLMIVKVMRNFIILKEKLKIFILKEIFKINNINIGEFEGNAYEKLNLASKYEPDDLKVEMS